MQTYYEKQSMKLCMGNSLIGGYRSLSRCLYLREAEICTENLCGKKKNEMGRRGIKEIKVR